MPAPAWIAIVVTLGLFVITHIVITVWWASRVNTLLDVVQKELSEIVAELRGMKSAYFTREEAVRELAIADKEHKAMWKRIDEMRPQTP